jgi:ATP-dependent RNA helicase DHX57
VVLTTNIAETAVTVDDCGFVIDCGRMKEKRFDAAKRMESLDDVLVSRANMKQRRGRAGRCQPGVAFHLVSSYVHDQVAESAQPPEIRRVPLERLVLTIKAMQYADHAPLVCSRLLEPPEPAAVKRAVEELAELDALDTSGGRETLTPLGAHLSTLPVDVRIGKFILLGAIFGVIDETLTIAATLSHRSPFLAPFDKRELADAAKRSFASEQSDHLAVLQDRAPPNPTRSFLAPTLSRPLLANPASPADTGHPPHLCIRRTRPSTPALASRATTSPARTSWASRRCRR